ncbi:MAG: QueT transporter family protein, partial [Candidatus Zixiibacteriota bacterium]
ISFGVYQVRIAEALTVLPFLTRAALPGLYIGCLIANMFGGIGIQDILLGPLLTLVAASLTRACSRIKTRYAITSLVVAPILITIGTGVYFFSQGLSSCHTVYRLAQFDILNLRNLASLVLLLWSLKALQALLVGILLILAAALLSALFISFRKRGENASLLVAPLPPVILNAFGVSLYLAPLLGFNYWFSVQMIGVGELIACYLLGLPLLMALRRRTVFGIET